MDYHERKDEQQTGSPKTLPLRETEIARCRDSHSQQQAFAARTPSSAF
jgi:hypothetical protein